MSKYLRTSSRIVVNAYNALKIRTILSIAHITWVYNLLLANPFPVTLQLRHRLVFECGPRRSIEIFPRQHNCKCLDRKPKGNSYAMSHPFILFNYNSLSSVQLLSKPVRLSLAHSLNTLANRKLNKSTFNIEINFLVLKYFVPYFFSSSFNYTRHLGIPLNSTPSVLT